MPLVSLPDRYPATIGAGPGDSGRERANKTLSRLNNNQVTLELQASIGRLN